MDVMGDGDFNDLGWSDVQRDVYERLSPHEAAEYYAAHHSNNQHLRIEALRAASRVVAGMPEYDMDRNFPSGQADFGEMTTRLADQFLRWLEDDARKD